MHYIKSTQLLFYRIFNSDLFYKELVKYTLKMCVYILSFSLLLTPHIILRYPILR